MSKATKPENRIWDPACECMAREDLEALQLRRLKKIVKTAWEKVPYYTIEDAFPYGHGEKSVFLIERFVRLKPAEATAIRWHMGGFDDLANGYGGRKTLTNAMQRYPLITALHMADLAASYFDGK